MSFLTKIFGNKAEDLSHDEADLALAAPLSGSVVPLEDVPDPVISEKIAGDGIAIDPESNTVCSPCDGTVCRVLSSGTAVAVRAACGLEIYIRVGFGTAGLTGQGFEALKAAGDSVKAGDPLLSFDPSVNLRQQQSALTTMIAIRSTAAIERVTSASGKVSSGDPCMWIYLKRPQSQA